MGSSGIHRFRYVATAFVTLLFMGLIYAWSLFVEPIEADFGWDRTQTSLNFTLSMIFFSVGMLAAGAIERRFSTKTLMIATGVIIGGGFAAASLVNTLMGIYLTYGVVVSFGVGVGTDVVMAAALKWYPDKQGFASGGMLMGFGMGAMLLSPPVTMLLSAFTWRVTFVILGVVFVVVMVAVAFLMHEPPADVTAALQAKAKAANEVLTRDYTALQMVRTKAFWLFFAWLILVTSGGLGLISQAVPAAQEVLVNTGMTPGEAVMLATVAMGGVSLCNGFGRLLNGIVWDKFGYRFSLTWVSVGFAASMGLCGIAMTFGSFPLIVVGFMLLGLAYGGNMSSMAAMSSGFFGTKHFGMNYAVATLQMIPAAFIGPMLLASFQQGSGSYTSAFWAFLAIAIGAFALSFLVKKPQD